MNEPTSGTPQAAPRRQVGIALGPVTLRGWQARLFLLVIISLIVYEIVRDKPWIDPSPLWLCGALWACFEIYWSIQARGAAATKSAESPKSRAVHTRLFLAAIVLFFIDVRGFNGHWIPPAAWVTPAGVAVQSAGLAFAIWSRRTLGRHWSGELTIKEGHEIVKSGPYRFIRHPIYTGILGMGLGSAMTSNTWHALIGFAVMAFAYVRKIRMEERWLLDGFGGAYAEYKRGSWALIPGIL